MIVALFPEPRERARAIGVFSFVAAAGGSIGLLAGGLLTRLGLAEGRDLPPVCWASNASALSTRSQTATCNSGSRWAR